MMPTPRTPRRQVQALMSRMAQPPPRYFRAKAPRVIVDPRGQKIPNTAGPIAGKTFRSRCDKLIVSIRQWPTATDASGRTWRLLGMVSEYHRHTRENRIKLPYPHSDGIESPGIRSTGSAIDTSPKSRKVCARAIRLHHASRLNTTTPRLPTDTGTRARKVFYL
jgi:hypothetical protein